MDSLKEYREMGFFPLQLNIIEKALRSNVDRSLIRKYIINTSLDNMQMEIILNGLIHELDVELYCHPDIPYEQMQDVYLKLLEDKQKEISSKEMEAVKRKTMHVSKTAFYVFILASIVGIGFILYVVVYPIYLAQHENLEINFKEDHIKINYKDSFNVLENIESYTKPESYKLLYNQPSFEKLGVHLVEVTLSNGFKTITQSFNLEIVDTLKPILSLKKQTERLYLKDMDEFDCKDYIDSVSDNYDNQLMDLVTCKLDNQEIGEHEIVYTIKDSSNNTTTQKLILIIEENPKSIPKPNTESNFASSSQNNQNNSSNNSSFNQSQTQSPAPTNSNSPFIAGVGDIRVSVDSDLGDLVFRLTSNITASGSVSVDYSAVNLSVAGSYPVYYRSSDGASASVTVYVN